MSENQQVARREPTEALPTERDQCEPSIVIVAPADVYEDADGITLQLDIPGVSKERLNLQANKNTLLIEGNARLDMPHGMTALCRHALDAVSAQLRAERRGGKREDRSEPERRRAHGSHPEARRSQAAAEEEQRQDREPDDEHVSTHENSE
jgi:hypothetical protein